MVVIAFLIVINNFDIREIRAEEFGQGSLIASFVKDKQTDITETMETALQIKNPPSSSALSGALNPKEIKTISEETKEAITTETQGALLKPQALTSESQPRYKVEYHIVEPGDTVSSIAEEFNLSVNTILWENKLGPRDYIKPGDKLTILPVDGVSHQIKKGDTLEKIASNYKANLDTIMDYNQLADAHDIEENEILIIPEGQPPTPPEPKITPRKYAFLEIPPPSRIKSSSRFLWPTTSKKINQYFKWRHTGIDIEGNYSSPVYAADLGRVEFAGSGGGYGLYIIINHGGGVKTLYGHESKLFVRKGDYVEKGQTIGMIGCTGWCTGPHVHFEVWISGRKVNPLSYL